MHRALSLFFRTRERGREQTARIDECGDQLQQEEHAVDASRSLSSGKITEHVLHIVVLLQAVDQLEHILGLRFIEHRLRLRDVLGLR